MSFGEFDALRRGHEWYNGAEDSPQAQQETLRLLRQANGS